MQDVKITTAAGNFKFRVGGILICNDRVLVVEMNDNGHYCLPGGHVELGEDTKTAVVREMGEELGYEVVDKQLVAMIENFYYNPRKNNHFHELGYYYIVEPKDMAKCQLDSYMRMEQDKDHVTKLDFKWVPLTDLASVDFRPKFLGEQLSQKNFNLTHYINKE